MNNIRVLLLLSFIITLVKVTCADNVEQFYLITVKDTTPKSHHKRQEVSSSVEATIDAIHNLIVENKDTFVNPEKLDELDENDAQLKKRNMEYVIDYGSSNYVYQIATLNSGRSILYGYLNEKIVKSVMKLPNVISCNPDKTYKPDSYNESEIISESEIKNYNFNTAFSSHLSLISQGIYDKSYFKYYDSNYYYPKKGGKDVDIYIFDVGFNFNNSEFSDTERKAKCILNIKNGKLVAYNDNNDVKSCFSESMNDHGTLCATVAAGKTQGAAPNANVYGVLMNTYDGGNVISGMRHIMDNYMVSGKKVIFNFSFSHEDNTIDNKPSKLKEKIKDENNKEYDKSEHDMIDEFVQKGGILFSSAGNEGMNVYDNEVGRAKYPCVYNNTICVGGFANKQMKESDYSYFSNSESIPYSLSQWSNYGKGVDIYAPFYFYLSYQNSSDYEEITGTSMGSPLTAGVAATLWSEFPDELDKDSKALKKDSMLKLLQNLAHKNVITKAPTPNYLLNNGRKIISLTSNNDRCGVNFGNKKCKNNLCCSADGYCGELYQHCFENCQQGFGKCYN